MTSVPFINWSIALQTVPPFLQETISDIVAYLPAILGAIVVLVIGWFVGRLLGGFVTRLVERVGVSGYTRGTPLEGGAGLAGALGQLVKYYVYFLAVLAAANILGIEILSQLLSNIGQYLPVVLGAVVILIVGFVVGRVVGNIVADVISGFRIGRYVRGTPLDEPSQNVGGFGRIVGMVVEYYIYLLALLAAAEALQIPALSELLSTFAGYAPALIGGLLVFVVGVLVAEFVEDIIDSVDDSRLTTVLGLAVKIFIYYITVTIALDTIGFDTTVLTNLFTGFVAAFFGALAIALALGIGLAVGLGGQDFVAENIDGWASTVRRRFDRESSETHRTGGTSRTDGPDDSDTSSLD